MVQLHLGPLPGCMCKEICVDENLHLQYLESVSQVQSVSAGAVCCFCTNLAIFKSSQTEKEILKCNLLAVWIAQLKLVKICGSATFNSGNVFSDCYRVVCIGVDCSLLYKTLVYKTVQHKHGTKFCCIRENSHTNILVVNFKFLCHRALHCNVLAKL